MITQDVYKRQICWFNRYAGQMFKGYQPGQIGTVVYLGCCKNNYEASFLKMISRLPLDVIILSPNLERVCSLKDERLVERCV